MARPLCLCSLPQPLPFSRPFWDRDADAPQHPCFSLGSAISDRYRHEAKTGLKNNLAIGVRPSTCTEVHTALATHSVNTCSHRGVYELRGCTPGEYRASHQQVLCAMGKDECAQKKHMDPSTWKSTRSPRVTIHTVTFAETDGHVMYPYNQRAKYIH